MSSLVLCFAIFIHELSNLIFFSYQNRHLPVRVEFVHKCLRRFDVIKLDLTISVQIFGSRSWVKNTAVACNILELLIFFVIFCNIQSLLKTTVGSESRIYKCKIDVSSFGCINRRGSWVTVTVNLHESLSNTAILTGCLVVYFRCNSIWKTSKAAREN